ncbi:glyoxalase/bleomycin resistance protein/dioxygenase [Hyaloraphidium curvatum]|nr:glyoxalase/bleomycin resistance protein/dioxygenase [Hyaloraphidium curvatum]
MSPDGGPPPVLGPKSLSKPCLDVGFFNNSISALAFWSECMGLGDPEPPVRFNGNLTQHRFALGDSVVKINEVEGGAEVGVPSGYSELYVADPAAKEPERVRDPDGNEVVRVPVGHLGITGIGVKVRVRSRKDHERFYGEIMGLERVGDGCFAAGTSRIFLEEDPGAERAGHWINAGFRYVTLHVKRVDASFEEMVARGAEVGERPYSIGKVARISFIRDPDGNWIEVAQRASLAGPWWTEEGEDGN